METRKTETMVNVAGLQMPNELRRLSDIEFAGDTSGVRKEMEYVHRAMLVGDHGEAFNWLRKIEDRVQRLLKLNAKQLGLPLKDYPSRRWGE